MEETDRISKARPTRLFACDYGCPRRCRQEECRATTATRGLSGKRAPQTNESPNQLPVHLDARFTSRCPQTLDRLYKVPRRSMRIVCMSFASPISPVGTKPFLRQKATRFGVVGRRGTNGERGSFHGRHDTSRRLDTVPCRGVGRRRGAGVRRSPHQLAAGAVRRILEKATRHAEAVPRIAAQQSVSGRKAKARARSGPRLAPMKRTSPLIAIPLAL